MRNSLDEEIPTYTDIGHKVSQGHGVNLYQNQSEHLILSQFPQAPQIQLHDSAEKCFYRVRSPDIPELFRLTPNVYVKEISKGT